ncbi:Uncharacterized protein APZ42_025944 [Daphnia magna]|uniref:Uncharacterized protein n=1 Tax=Daphnia magna TaxID=35525 RepID=A0A164SM73_9CRUS|nr:Uncharacterized protein APZ42_025944 [Daphnia magna]
MPFDSPVQKTALNENTLLPLYPVLQESDFTDQDPNLSHHREQFSDHWKTLIDLEFKQDLERSKSYQTISTTESIQQLQTQKQEASQALGELFSREDKKSIPIFKGKRTDKLLSEWLRVAEDVARNNE